MPKKSALPNLETSLAEISTLIETMEQGNLSLEQSLSQFERGVSLIKHAQKILQEADQKVKILIQNKTQEFLEVFENQEKLFLIPSSTSFYSLLSSLFYVNCH